MQENDYKEGPWHLNQGRRGEDMNYGVEAKWEGVKLMD